MYLLFLTFIMGATYLVLFEVFSLFFKHEITRLHRRMIFSIGLIIILSFFSYLISYLIPDKELGNRFLHAFGGGFLSFFICFLVVKDGKIPITKFQFFLFSFLIVTAMGVANEIMEFVLQNYTGFIFADTINDTWLDLTSNSIGALIAAAIFTPLLDRDV